MPIPGGEITGSSIWTAESTPAPVVDVNLATRCECGGPLDYVGDYDPTVLYKRIHTPDCKKAKKPTKKDEPLSD